MVTVNETRKILSILEKCYTPEIHKILNNGLDEFSKKLPDVDDYRTNVIFSWRGFSITHDSAQKILLGCQSFPDGLVMKINVKCKSVH